MLLAEQRAEKKLEDKKKGTHPENHPD